MNEYDIQAIENAINMYKSTGSWLSIKPEILEKLYNEYKKLKGE